jgi:hypothetical protein
MPPVLRTALPSGLVKVKSTDAPQVAVCAVSSTLIVWKPLAFTNDAFRMSARVNLTPLFLVTVLTSLRTIDAARVEKDSCAIAAGAQLLEILLSNKCRRRDRGAHDHGGGDASAEKRESMHGVLLHRATAPQVNRQSKYPRKEKRLQLVEDFAKTCARHCWQLVARPSVQTRRAPPVNPKVRAPAFTDMDDEA